MKHDLQGHTGLDGRRFLRCSVCGATFALNTSTNDLDASECKANRFGGAGGFKASFSFDAELFNVIFSGLMSDVLKPPSDSENDGPYTVVSGRVAQGWLDRAGLTADELRQIDAGTSLLQPLSDQLEAVWRKKRRE